MLAKGQIANAVGGSGVNEEITKVWRFQCSQNISRIVGQRGGECAQLEAVLVWREPKRPLSSPKPSQSLVYCIFSASLVRNVVLVVLAFMGGLHPERFSQRC